MIKKFIILTKGIFFIAFITACGTSKKSETTYTPIDCNTVTEISYKNDILPILEPNCASGGCHNDKSRKHNISVLNLDDVKKAASKGELLGTIKHEKGYPKMPMFKPKLKNEDIQKIECWVKNGMKE
jgi:hypothetical protein